MKYILIIIMFFVCGCNEKERDDKSVHNFAVSTVDGVKTYAITSGTYSVHIGHNLTNDEDKIYHTFDRGIAIPEGLDLSKVLL